MKGFNKAAIAAVTAAAVTTSLCVPASAEETATAGVKVENNVCTITLNQDEAKLLELDATQTVKKDEAKTKLDALVQKLTERETYIKGLDAQVKDKKVTKEDADKQKAQFKKEQTAAASVSAAYRACAEGKELSESDYDLAGIFSSVKGEPNETSIGIIVGASVLLGLGALAALLPQLKGVLPAPIADLLP